MRRERLATWDRSRVRARAGIQYVELNDRMLDGFLENDTLAAAGRVMTDLGADTGLRRRRPAGYLESGSSAGGIARDVANALRTVCQPWPAEDLLSLDHDVGSAGFVDGLRPPGRTEHRTTHRGPPT